MQRLFQAPFTIWLEIAFYELLIWLETFWDYQNNLLFDALVGSEVWNISWTTIQVLPREVNLIWYDCSRYFLFFSLSSLKQFVLCIEHQDNRVSDSCWTGKLRDSFKIWVLCFFLFILEIVSSQKYEDYKITWISSFQTSLVFCDDSSCIYYFQILLLS